MSNQEANRRIARNTVINYVQLFITMLVGLITSRIVLQALGVSDYGLYNVVGGLLGMFTFISSSLGIATTRFINFEMGKPEGDLNRIFNICLVLHIVFALLILLLAETVGLWYINNYLKVAPGREADAMFVYQITTAVACIGIINVPYQGLLNAYEKFGHIAAINIVNVLLKLGMVVLLLYISGNLLRIYAIMMSVGTLVSFIAYHWICIHYWPDVIRHRFVRHDSAYREILAFNNYNILNSASLMAKNTGSNLLINFFFGTVVNGAFGIAVTVQTYVNSLIVNIDAAAAPQITQNYSSGNLERCTSIVNKINRYSILVMEVACATLFVELDGVLDIWLKDVPEGELLFCQLILAMLLVSSTSVGLTQYINASGKIKWFRIINSIIFLMCIPAGYFAFKAGLQAYWIIIIFIIADVLWRTVQLILMHRKLGFDVPRSLKEVYPRVIAVLLVLIVWVLLYRAASPAGLWRVFGFLLTGLVSAAAAVFIGLDAQERRQGVSLVSEKLRGFRK